MRNDNPALFSSHSFTRLHSKPGFHRYQLTGTLRKHFEYDHATYSPANYGKAYSMHDVMLREGLIRSLNVVTVDLAMRTGLSRSPQPLLDSDYPGQTLIRQWPLALRR